MWLKLVITHPLLAVLILLLAACGGGSQVADTPPPEAKVVAKAEIETAPTTVPPPKSNQAVSPKPSAVTPAVARREGGRIVISFSPETEARYRVNEQLARRNLPNDAVGVTNTITGIITFDAAGKVIPEESKITIDVSTLKSDSNRRDNYLRNNALETDRFPTVDFVIKDTPGLTWPLPSSGDELFRLIGDLTIRGVTSEVTWNANATFTSDRIHGLVETSFTFGDFEMSIPTGMFILSVEDLIRLELDFVAISSQR
jgi:polyisoprenoid-binding protein YceI